MVEQTIKEADATLLKNQGNRRINASVDRSKTPEQEIEDAKKNPAITSGKPYGPK